MHKIHVRLTLRKHNIDKYNAIERLLLDNHFQNFIVDETDNVENPLKFKLPIGEFYFKSIKDDFEETKQQILVILAQLVDISSDEYSLIFRKFRGSEFINL